MASRSSKVRFVCVSDTHNHAPGEGYTLPKGDVLVHAGDLTNQGSYEELKKAVAWLEKAEFPLKIVVAGNHDLLLDQKYSLGREVDKNATMDSVEIQRNMIQSIPGVVYLQHSARHIELPGREDMSFRLFGSPYSLANPGKYCAFQYSETEADELWAEIPCDTDVLITHTPPSGLCDASKHWQDGGCKALMKRLSHIKPALHICGHCHEGRGAQVVRWSESPVVVESSRVWEDPTAGTKKQSLLDLTGNKGGRRLEYEKETAVINASVMAKSFGRGTKKFNKPVVVDIEWPI